MAIKAQLRFGVLFFAALLCSGCGGGTSVKMPPAAPSASLTASPNSVVQGQAVLLSWHTSHATDVSIAGIGEVPASGSQSVTGTATTTYILTATGAGGTSQASAQVIVTPANPSPPFPAAWIVTELPPIASQTDSEATAINDAGDVIGLCNSIDVEQHGCLWRSDDLQHAVDLGGNFPMPNAINNNGQIVGADAQGHAFLWPDMLELTEPEGFVNSIATGINDFEEIVGTLFTAGRNSSAGFKWTRAGGMKVLPLCTQALAVSSGGVVVGVGQNNDTFPDGNAQECEGEAFFADGAATAINTFGVVVGVKIVVNVSTDAIEFPSTLISPGMAAGINDNGWVVGTVPATAALQVAAARARMDPWNHMQTRTWIPRNVGDFPTVFIWSPTEGLSLIPGMIQAVGINASGEVVGLGPNFNGFSQRAAVAIGAP